MSLFLVLLLGLACGAGCYTRTKSYFYSYTLYANGQLLCLPGDTDVWGRHGPWIYFRSDGSVDDGEFFQGSLSKPIEGTGYYVRGKRVRALTQDELDRRIAEFEPLPGSSIEIRR